MFYDELIALKERLEVALFLLSCDPTRTEKQIERGQLRILKELSLVNQKILEVEKKMFGCTNQYEAKVFKKEVKLEFLRQAKDGYPYEDILRFLELNFVNPGVNIEKFIEKLEYDEKTHKGYYRLDDVGGVSLTDKSERFLENVANVSLKR